MWVDLHPLDQPTLRISITEVKSSRQNNYYYFFSLHFHLFLSFSLSIFRFYVSRNDNIVRVLIKIIFQKIIVFVTGSSGWICYRSRLIINYSSLFFSLFLVSRVRFILLSQKFSRTVVRSYITERSILMNTAILTI